MQVFKPTLNTLAFSVPHLPGGLTDCHRRIHHTVECVQSVPAGLPDAAQAFLP